MRMFNNAKGGRFRAIIIKALLPSQSAEDSPLISIAYLALVLRSIFTHEPQRFIDIGGEQNMCRKK